MNSLYDNYEKNMGLEIHVELDTCTKLFCGCSTAYGGRANHQTCPVCAGLPGALPRLNKKAVEMAIKLGLSLNCDITHKTGFDRKNYYYPDNPQNYQITQLFSPICRNGILSIDGENIRIKEMHLEDDAARLIHNDNGTMIDFNRSGVPLIEIVTEPDFTESEHIVRFLKELVLILKVLKISDCRMQEGSLRIDVNISVKKNNCPDMGVRTEIKNLNSFSEIVHMVDYEKKRQVDMIEKGIVLRAETRSWNERKQSSQFMRIKETERDYRYYPEPDIPVLCIENEDIDRLRKELPILPEAQREHLKRQYCISKSEASFLVENENALTVFEECTNKYQSDAKTVLNRLTQTVAHIMTERNMAWDDLKINTKSLAELIQLTQRGNISRQTENKLLELLIEQDFDVREYIKTKDLMMNKNENDYRYTIQKTIQLYPKAVSDYKQGRIKAVQFLVGCCMREMSGRADAEVLKQSIINELNRNEDE